MRFIWYEMKTDVIVFVLSEETVVRLEQDLSLKTAFVLTVACDECFVALCSGCSRNVYRLRKSSNFRSYRWVAKCD